MYKIKINKEFEFEMEEKDLLSNRSFGADISKIGDGEFHVIYKHRSYQIQVISSANQGKQSVIKVNGQIVEAKIADHFDGLLAEMGMTDPKERLFTEIKAPMPGLVLKVMVSEGQVIQKGESLFVLEAMKMENLIKSTTAGTVKKILIVTGDKVEKNQVLLAFL